MSSTVEYEGECIDILMWRMLMINKIFECQLFIYYIKSLKTNIFFL